MFLRSQSRRSNHMQYTIFMNERPVDNLDSIENTAPVRIPVTFLIFMISNNNNNNNTNTNTNNGIDDDDDSSSKNANPQWICTLIM